MTHMKLTPLQEQNWTISNISGQVGHRLHATNSWVCPLGERVCSMGTLVGALTSGLLCSLATLSSSDAMPAGLDLGWTP